MARVTVAFAVAITLGAVAALTAGTIHAHGPGMSRMVRDTGPMGAESSATRPRATIVTGTAGITGASETAGATAATVATAATAIVGAAVTSATAVRGERVIGPLPPAPSVANPLLVGCDATLLQHLMESDPTSSQWIMVVVPSTTSTVGTLAIATVRDTAWECSLATTTAQVGRSGVRPLIDRRSGDGTTPSGIFPLGVVASPQGPISFFGNSANPGAHGSYRTIQNGDCYGANPNTPGYGHWRVDSTTCTGDDELLERNVQSYEHAVLIGANTEPNVSGDAPGEIPYAAAIFLHRTAVTTTGAAKPTAGCVSIGHTQLVAAVRTIDPALSPRFAIGTRADLLAG
ncbi:MAG: L,D-transpeptidase family protein [Ilumatobacteraceae bacterium]